MTSTCYLKTDALEAAVRFLADKGFLAVSVVGDDSMVVVSILAATQEDRQLLGDLLGRATVTQFALLAKRDDWIRSGGTVEPDYRSLVELLPNLRRVPDALGDTELSEDEAARIQSHGFTVAPGPWNVPALPDELVMGNGLLEMLSETWRAQNEGRDPPEYAFNPRHDGILGVHETDLRPTSVRLRHWPSYVRRPTSGRARCWPRW